jgi:hypothetical protein
VGLIHREERNLDSRERIEEAVRAEAFRGDVNEFVFALAHSIEAFLLFRPTERGVDHGGRDAAGDERVHLVFHQRDEGRDDEGDTAETKRGDLEAERFAAAGGHDDESVTTGDDFGNDFLLAVEKSGEPEMLFERRVGRGDQGFRLFGRLRHRVRK